MVCVFELPEKYGTDFIEMSRPFLSEQRIKKMSVYKMEQDRINSCAVYILLRYALFCEYGIKEAPEFIFGDHEKPFLRDYPEIFFNMSHCKTAVCCTVSDSNTAVDINDYRTVGDGVIRSVCSQKEQETIAQSDKPDVCFMKLWTRKECYSKLTGKGMSMDFSIITDDIPELKNIRTVAAEDYVLSYYSPKEEEILTVNEKTIAETLKNLQF